MTTGRLTSLKPSLRYDQKLSAVVRVTFFEFISKKWANIMIKIFLSFVIQRRSVSTRMEKDLISLVISETLAFLTFNKLNSVYAPLATV